MKHRVKSPRQDLGPNFFRINPRRFKVNLSPAWNVHSAIGACHLEGYRFFSLFFVYFFLFIYVFFVLVSFFATFAN